ncbi:hypothetical protein ACA910_013388 [Epithemia clementina (nom. ined.)]
MEETPSHGEEHHPEAATPILVPPVWEHAFTELLGHGPDTIIGINLCMWVLHQQFSNNLEEFCIWYVRDFLLDAESISRGTMVYIVHHRTTLNPTHHILHPNQVKQLRGLWQYVVHLYMTKTPNIYGNIPSLEHDNWINTTASAFRQWLIDYHCDLGNSTSLNISGNNSVTPSVSSGSSSSTSTTTLRNGPLDAFKRGIKQDPAAYPTLKDEKYYDHFFCSFSITAKSHDCDEILNKFYIPPGDPESQELFQRKNVFLYGVLTRTLLTDMGKDIVQRYYRTTDAQAVWHDFQAHILTSTKGSSERRRLTSFVTNTILDNSFKGSTEQFVLHFHEQLRKLDDITPNPTECIPVTMRINLLQHAVSEVPALAVVESLDELVQYSHTSSSTTMLTYDKYRSLLLNACIKYDQKKIQSSGKSRAVYQLDNYGDYDDSFDQVDTYEGTHEGGIDLPSDLFMSVNTASRPPQPPPRCRPGTPCPTPPNSSTPNQNNSTVFLPPDIYKLLTQDVKDAIMAHNTALRQNPIRSTNAHVSFSDETPSDASDDPDTTPDSAFPIEEDHHASDQEPLSHLNDDTITNMMQAYQTRLSRSTKPSRPREIKMVAHYHVAHAQASRFGSLVDRGANGGLAGADVHILSCSNRKISVTGIGNHELSNLDIVTCAGIINTNHGRVVLIMNEYAYYGQGNSIHSAGQIEWYKNQVDDKSVNIGGTQCITFLDGYATPLECRNGLMYLNILAKPTDEDIANLPSVFLTSPHEWDPCVLDYSHPFDDSDPPWAPKPQQRDLHDPRFDHLGHYTRRIVNHLNFLADAPSYSIAKHDFTAVPPDYSKLRPFFGWSNKETIRKTFEQTTQWTEAITTYPMRRHIKSRFPTLNVHCRKEPVATDTIFSDTPAVDNGSKMAQLFVGKDTLVADVYPLKRESQFVNSLEDNIRNRGAMSQLTSDYAKVEISTKVMDILRAYHSSSWHSEPYHQNQNSAEGCYCTIKSWTNTVMNRSGAPASCWLLCLMYVCYILNRISTASLGGAVPLCLLTGITPDISIMLLYIFYQQVLYATHDQSFPSDSEERLAYWVGFGEHVGDALTHKLLDAKTNKIIYRSAVRPLNQSEHPNKRLFPDGGELPDETNKPPKVFISSRHDEDPSINKPMPDFNPEDLIGKTFLMPIDNNGERLRATVTDKVIEICEQLGE